MDTTRVLNNQIYNLHYVKTFRHTFWDSYKAVSERTNILIEGWLFTSPEGQWLNKKAIDITWEEHLDQSTDELVVRVTGYIQPKHWTEYALKFLDNST